VGGLLTFSKEHRPEKNMVNLNDIVNNSLNLLEYEFRVDNISLDLNLSPDLPKTSADPYQFQQVFINLIKNAQYALKEKGGGKLTVRSFHQDDKTTIEFIDDGIGMPKEILKKVFDPFFTTREVGQGTGLGLSIVFGIINEHGGRIDVESEVGKGSKFRILLPVTTGTVRDEYIKASKSKKLEKPISILIIDDEDSLRNYISEVLSLEGYVIKACSKGEEAIQLLKTNDYDIIISDIKMPGMNGRDIYDFISEKKPELIEKILFITGDVLGKRTQSFLRTTKCNYIEKPFEIDKLLNEINEIVSSQ
jgi:two-component system NtrC family sensor kinase